MVEYVEGKSNVVADCLSRMTSKLPDDCEVVDKSDVAAFLCLDVVEDGWCDACGEPFG